jgi:hypothetical protein
MDLQLGRRFGQPRERKATPCGYGREHGAALPIHGKDGLPGRIVTPAGYNPLLLQDIAALMLARDLRLAQRSGTYSLRLPGVASGASHPQIVAPLGGVERPGRKEPFVRLIHRRGRVLGGPAVRAAFGGNLIATGVDHSTQCGVTRWVQLSGDTPCRELSESPNACWSTWEWRYSDA